MKRKFTFTMALAILLSFGLKAQYSVVYRFLGDENGYSPTGSLISDGTYLYGITPYGGLHYDQYNKPAGTVFKIRFSDNVYTKMHDFNDINGGTPLYTLNAEGEYLYGVTASGGTTNNGTIFGVNKTNNTFSKLLDFNGTNGKTPTGALISDGTNLYGVAQLGGIDGFGSVFKFNIQTRKLTTMHHFNGSDGAHPLGGLYSDGV